jgi:DNA-binding GntR family transcriptional regulator
MPMADPSMKISSVAAPVRRQVVTSFRSAIVSGRFQPGDRLIEKELCDLTGASRTSVREALRQLETEGLVELISNKGPVVASTDMNKARNVSQVRLALESLAWGHPNLNNGDHIRVEGMFETEHHQGRYTFYNEVEATKVARAAQ